MDVESSTNYKAHLNHRFSNEPNLMTSKKTALVIFKPLSYRLKGNCTRKFATSFSIDVSNCFSFFPEVQRKTGNDLLVQCIVGLYCRNFVITSHNPLHHEVVTSPPWNFEKVH